MLKSVCLLLGENPRGNLRLQRCTMCPQYVQRLTNQIRIDFGLSVNANTAAVAANDPRRFKSASSERWTVASPTWGMIEQKMKMAALIGFMPSCLYAFINSASDSQVNSLLHPLTLRKSVPHTWQTVNVLNWQKSCASFAQSDLNCCTPSSLVSESPQWDIKPFCTPCTQIETKSSQEVEVCCRQQDILEDAEDQWEYQRVGGPRKPTQQNPIPHSSPFADSCVAFFQHGLLISFSIYPSQKTRNKAP